MDRKSVIAIDPSVIFTTENDKMYVNNTIVNLMKQLKNLTGCRFVLWSCFDKKVNTALCEDLWKACNFKFDAVNENLVSFEEKNITCEKKIYADMYIEKNMPCSHVALFEELIRVNEVSDAIYEVKVFKVDGLRFIQVSRFHNNLFLTSVKQIETLTEEQKHRRITTMKENLCMKEKKLCMK